MHLLQSAVTSLTGCSWLPTLQQHADPVISHNSPISAQDEGALSRLHQRYGNGTGLHEAGEILKGTCTLRFCSKFTTDWRNLLRTVN